MQRYLSTQKQHSKYTLHNKSLSANALKAPKEDHTQ